MQLWNFSSPELVTALKGGKIGILPTDTIYGIHASALDPNAIEKMYEIRLRDTNKPFIVLIDNPHEVSRFSVSLTTIQQTITSTLWNLGVSIILPVKDQRFSYLTRQTGGIAFRVPKKEPLVTLLQKTGPLVSTSVNKQGEKPSETIEEALLAFDNELDFAVDEGVKRGEPSTVVILKDKGVSIVRQGNVRIPSEYLTI